MLDPPGASASPEPPGGVLQAVNHSTLDTFFRPTYHRVGQRESAMTDFEIFGASITITLMIMAVVYAIIRRGYLTSWLMGKVVPQPRETIDISPCFDRLYIRSATIRKVRVERMSRAPWVQIEGRIESLVGLHRFRFEEMNRSCTMVVRMDSKDIRVRPGDCEEAGFWVHETRCADEPSTFRRLDPVFIYGRMIQSADYFLQKIDKDLARVFNPSLGE